MNFQPLPVAGAFLVEPQRIEDDRGSFARTFCREEFAARGLAPELAQISISFNHLRGTLRGMHYQADPHAEAKVVRCTRGAIRDALVDLRPGSPSFLKWALADLTAENAHAMYVPEGCAHGFLTLEDASEVLYQMSTPFHGPSARGVRWDDPAFGIEWREPVLVISDRDRNYPDFGK